MKQIELTQGKVALVDDEDYEWLSQWKWSYSHGYALRNRPGRGQKHAHIYMHREILKPPDNMESDHINGNRLDNQKENLRICNSTQNKGNACIRSDNTSGHKGVFWNKYRQKWQAQIEKKGKNNNLGLFINMEDAIKAYEKAAAEYFGEFARI
jgi:hypothetical protein